MSLNTVDFPAHVLGDCVKCPLGARHRRPRMEEGLGRFLEEKVKLQAVGGEVLKGLKTY